MARISFTAPERGGLLAKAVLDTGAYLADDGDGDGHELDNLTGLAEALDQGDGRRFDELLVEHFRDVALEASGLAPSPADEAEAALAGPTGDGDADPA